MKIFYRIVIIINTIFIYLFLPLLGWGFDNMRSFFDYPQLTVYSISIPITGFVVGWKIKHPAELGNRGKGQADKFVPRQRIIRFLVTGLLLAGLILAPYADRRSIAVMPDLAAIRWVGLILEIIGMSIILWSGFSLGRLYSPEVTLQAEHKLVTDGLYSFIRHPRYLGGFIQGVGLSLLFRSWAGILITNLFLVIILFRIRDEELLMSQEFGDSWKRYCQETWRMIPYIF